MFGIKIYGESFEQEIRLLLKSFLPEEELQVVCGYALPPSEEWYGIVFYLEKEHISIIYSKPGRLDLKLSDSLLQEELEAESKEYHKFYRNRLLRLLFCIFYEAEGKTLPWGILTGVRPTKIILELFQKGCTENEIRTHMRKNYLCSAEKLNIGLEVAKKEIDLLNTLDYKNGYSLYLGIPFCPSICHYCSFSSFPLTKYEAMVEPYLTALELEIEYAAECFPDRKLHTIYFGGGTPTTLNAKQLRRILTKVRKHFDLSNLKELTVEAGRPDSITMEKLLVLKEQGVSRVSINPQTMRQSTLDLIGRGHTAEQVEEAFWMAREAGHENINMDMIIGLTGEGISDVEYTLERIKKMNPDSLTVHTLAVKRAARLNTQKQKYHGMEANHVAEMMQLASRFAEDQKYHPYYLYRQKYMSENLENVGYARTGKEGLYNVLIMEEKQLILALGAGASSKFVFHGENRFERVENVKNIPDYINRIDEMIERKKHFLKSHKNSL